MSLTRSKRLRTGGRAVDSRAAARARKSLEPLLAKVQEIAHLGSWSFDIASGRLTLSDEVYRIFGLRPQRFGATYQAFLARVHPEDRDAVNEAYSGSIRDGKDTCEIEHRIVRPDTDEIRWVSEKYEHIRNGSGEVVRSIGIVRDITRRKQAELQKDLYAEILRILNRDGIGAPDSVREVIAAIRAWSGFDAIGLRLRRGDDYPYFEQNGFSQDFLQEENFLCARYGNGAILRDPEGRPVLECTCGLVLSSQTDPSLPFFTGNGSFWTNCASGLLSLPAESDPRIHPRNNCIHQGYQSVAIIPVRSGNETLGLLQLNDRRENRLSAELVSFFEGIGHQLGIALRRTQVQEELRSLNESLERQVAERTAVAEQRAEQLRQLASKLTMAEDRERQRLAQALHDGLQQFLAGAKFRLATMGQSSSGRAEIAEVLSILDKAIDTSRSLTAELSPPILHQGGLAAGLNWLARWLRDNHGMDVQLRIQPGLCPPAENVSVFLFQGAKELLLNVKQHSGTVSALVEFAGVAGEVRISVQDAGAGFDQATIRSRGGSNGGFGLFELEERISMLGGRMEVESAPGAGAKVTLIVPGTKVAAEEPGKPKGNAGQAPPVSRQQSRQPEAATSIRVVLVDDHAILRRGLSVMLQAHPDIEVVGEAADGETAVELVRKLRPDVVLMDISMPGMDGIQATKIVHLEFPEISVIGLSMFEAGEQAAAMRAAGAVNYLAKSGPPNEVVAAIRACCRAARKRGGCSPELQKG